MYLVLNKNAEETVCGEMGRRENEASYRHHSVVREQQGLSRATKMNAFGGYVLLLIPCAEKMLEHNSAAMADSLEYTTKNTIVGKALKCTYEITLKWTNIHFTLIESVLKSQVLQKVEL